ncbi:MAG: outer membrane protein transport protein [Ketobacter sp.]|nr:outer membrane protein transport protein [Ketobacter sp.]
MESSTGGWCAGMLPRALAFFVLSLWVSSAWAVVADSLTIGNAKALSLGNAVTADPPGIDSIHFNPAGLARIKGQVLQLKMVAADFSVVMDIGDYVDARKNRLQEMEATGLFEDGYFDDEAHMSTSETEGAALMLPFFGLTELPAIAAPLGGASYSPPGKDVTFATNVYAPMMVGFYRQEDDPGRFIGERMSLMHLTYFSPSFGLKVTDEFAVGAALTFNYVGVGMDLPIRAPHAGQLFLGDLQSQCDFVLREEFVGFQDLAPQLCRGERLGLYNQLAYLEFEVEQELVPGLNVGLLWSPTEWLTLGANYIHSFPIEMDGWFRWTNGDNWVAFMEPLLQPDANGVSLAGQLNSALSLMGWSFPQGQNLTEGDASIAMEMPEQLMLGLSLQVTDYLKVNVDYKFSGWSSWQVLEVTFSEPVDFLRLAEIIQPDLAGKQRIAFPLGLEDTWNWALGVEYQYSTNSVVRFGVEDRPTSLPDDGLTPLLPLGSGTLYGAGLGLKLDSDAVIEVGIGYMKSSLEMPGGSAQVGNSLDPSKLIYSPYAGSDLNVELEMFLLEFSISQPF